MTTRSSQIATSSLFAHPWFFWGLLSIPSIAMLGRLVSDPASAGDILHPSGEFAARFMIVSMMATPLHMIWPKAAWTRWLLRSRRALGVAAFGYAALHTLIYLVDVETLQDALAEFWTLGIWTGWAAFAIFIPLAVTSNNTLQRYLAKAWRPLHRWVYAAAILTLMHWIFIQDDSIAPLIEFTPLAVLETYRIAKNLFERFKSVAV